MRWMMVLGLVAWILSACDSDGGEIDAGIDAAPECEIPADCDDGIECTVDACIDDECRNTPRHSDCDDGDVCNGSETCSVHRGCEEGEPMACDDTIVCTVDVCDPERGRCISEPDDELCDDGYFCDPPLGGCSPEE